MDVDAFGWDRLLVDGIFFSRKLMGFYVADLGGWKWGINSSQLSSV
jgi:hypothetical protein